MVSKPDILSVLVPFAILLFLLDSKLNFFFLYLLPVPLLYLPSPPSLLVLFSFLPPGRLDLLFLVTLTSSVCMVSEAIKMVERWRGAEKTPPTDFFHQV